MEHINFRMNLRPYQTDCLSAIRLGWEEFDRQLVVAPTGSGKTVIFSMVAREFADAGERTLVLVDQTELAFQTVDKMKSAAGLVCEVEKAEFRASKDAQVVVATVQTMLRRLDDWPQDHFGLVIADEADKSISSSWKKVLKHFDGHARVCGFTATPNRSDKRNLGEYYDSVAYEIGLFDLIKQGFLAAITVKMLPISLDMKGVHTKGGDFDTTELHDIVEPHLRECALAIKEYASFRKTLVFVPMIATSKKFVEICRSVGLAAEHIDGTSEDRAEKLKRFECGEFDILVNSSLLLRGVDIPSIDCVFMLRPTQSITLFQQAIGRGTRLAPYYGKEDLLLLDPLYVAEKRMICRPAHLIAVTNEEAEAITTIAEAKAAIPSDMAAQMPLDLQGLASEAQSQRERALVDRLAEHKDKKLKTISAQEFAIKHHDMVTAEFEPSFAWERREITMKQSKALKRAGIDIATVSGRGHANRLLNLYFQNQKMVLASPGQRAFMRRMNHPNAEHATAAEARTFFANMNKK